MRNHQLVDTVSTSYLINTSGGTGRNKVMLYFEVEPKVGIIPLKPGLTNKDETSEEGERVVSIWICMNMTENSMNHYHLTNDALLGNQKWEGKEDMISIVLLGLSKELPEHDEDYELHRLLGALLSKSLTQAEKLNIIGNEYDIPLEDEFRKELGSMCNLSQGIVEDTEERIIMSMYDNDIAVEKIAVIVKKTVEEVQAIIKSNQAILV
jgi:hypothetical protein